MSPLDDGKEAPADPAERAAEPTRACPWKRAVPALRVVLAAAILVVLTLWVGPESVLERLAAFPWPAALASFLAALLAHWLAALRMRLLAGSQGLPLTSSKALSINLSAVFYGLFLPGGSAASWAVRLFRLSPGTSQVATALLVLAGDRALATATGAGIGLVAGLSMASPAMPDVVILLLATLGVASLLCLILFTSSLDAGLAFAMQLPGVRRVATYLRSRGGFERRAETRTVISAILLSAGVHVSGVLSWLILAMALGLGVEPLVIAWVRSAAMVIALFPATVGGLGLREGVVVYVLTGLDVAGADALSLSLLVFVVTVMAFGIVGGLLEAHRLVTRRA